MKIKNGSDSVLNSSKINVRRQNLKIGENIQVIYYDCKLDSLI
jgi:hypothetical protein